jgi:hypothetical protein
MLLAATMSEATVSDEPDGDRKIDATKDLGIPLFECRLAIEIAMLTSKRLAKRRSAKELKPQLEELVRLLGDCSKRFELLTERLDAMVKLRGDAPN